MGFESLTWHLHQLIGTIIINSILKKKKKKESPNHDPPTILPHHLHFFFFQWQKFKRKKRIKNNKIKMCEWKLSEAATRKLTYRCPGLNAHSFSLVKKSQTQTGRNIFLLSIVDRHCHAIASKDIDWPCTRTRTPFLLQPKFLQYIQVLVYSQHHVAFNP